jgi:DNA-binding protein HU-beta
MNKSELSKVVADKLGMTPKQVGGVVDAVFDEIIAKLVAKDSVTIGGFGTFATKDRAAREGINPLTREPIQIPAKTVAVFKPTKTLKEL